MGRRRKDDPEQATIPGVAQEKNKKVDRAARAFAAARDEVAKARIKANDKKARLLEILKEEGIPTKNYVFGDIKIQDNSKEDVKVRVGDQVDDDDEDEQGQGQSGEGTEGPE